MANHEQSLEAGWQAWREHFDRGAGEDIPADLRHLLRAVAGVRDPVMSCEECQTWLPSYVDAEIGGLAVGRRYPEVKQHLDLCATCMVDYLEVLEWAVEEEQMGIPVVASMPTPDLSFLPTSTPISLSDFVRTVTDKFFVTLGAKRAREYQMMADMFFKRIEMAGEGFVFQPTPVLSSKPNTMQHLVVAYNTVQELKRTFSHEKFDILLERGHLEMWVRGVLEDEAEQHGFRYADANAFANMYAKVVCEDVEVLRRVVGG